MKIKHRHELIKLIEHFGLPRTVAEVGVAEGRFAEQMHNWGLDELYLIDIWERMPFIDGCASFEDKWHKDNYEEVQKRFEGKLNVVILKGFSHKMSSYIDNESLGLVYIDGDHSYNGCKSDIETWLPKLVPGGIMAFHDYGNNIAYGVQRAVIEKFSEAGTNIIEEDGKLENIGAWIRK